MKYLYIYRIINSTNAYNSIGKLNETTDRVKILNSLACCLREACLLQCPKTEIRPYTLGVELHGRLPCRIQLSIQG